jgi:hypothetical protein
MRQFWQPLQRYTTNNGHWTVTNGQVSRAFHIIETIIATIIETIIESRHCD